MSIPRTCAAAALAALTACSSPTPGTPLRAARLVQQDAGDETPFSPTIATTDDRPATLAPFAATLTTLPSRGYGHWSEGDAIVQGFFGATLFQKIERTGGGIPSVSGTDTSLSQMPTIGGGGQLKLAGKSLDFGVEGQLAFSWRTSGRAVITGGNGAVVAVDVGLVLVDLYGGPFVNVFLSDRVRVYGAAGPLMQWADYDQEGGLGDSSGSGFGLGYYTRAGIEADLGGTLVGVGVRWTQSSVDLSGDSGDLEMDGLMLGITVAHWY